MNPFHAETWARFYYDCGLNPLPSRTDRKGPALEHYADYRDGRRIPEEWLNFGFWRNIQLCCGVPWRLLVVDVDGPRALEQWFQWHLLGREWPETWTVRTKGGRHFYYRIPEGVATCPTRKIWLEVKERRPVKHSEIQILADKALVIAPPSKHVDPPYPVYAFMDGRGPADIEMATAPTWLLNCREFKVLSRPRRMASRRRPVVAMHQREWESIESIPDSVKLALARSWGLRTASNGPNSKGWVCCHAIDRDDEHPSASLHLASGVFWQSGQRAMSFPGLAVALGAARDLPEAFEMLGIKPLEAAK